MSQGEISAKQSRWGLPVTYGLTEVEAYDAMLIFLKALWQRGGKSPIDLATVLGFINRNAELNLCPGDPAQWEDWLDAVQAVMARRPNSN